MFDIKNKSLEATEFILIKAQEEYLFARGWRKIYNNMFEPKDIIDFYGLDFSLSEDGYNLNYAMNMQTSLENKLKYG